MATIADNIAELMRIRLEMKEFAKIPDDVPFEHYGAWLAWAGEKAPAQPLMADFVNKRYSKDGVPCRFEDIFEFERLSKAWDFVEGELKEYEVGEARFRGKGLLIEPESTNYYLYSKESLIWDTGGSAVSKPDYLKVDGGWTVGKGEGNTRLVGYVMPAIDSSDRSYYSIFIEKDKEYRYVKLDTGHGNVWSCVIDLISCEIIQRNSTRNRNVVLLDKGDFLEVRQAFDRTSGTDYYSRNFGISALPELVISSNKLWTTGYGEWSVKYLTMSYGNESYSPILTQDSPTTRLQETLTLKNPTQPIVVDADEGIIQDGTTFSGFGHIRKIEVK